MIYIVRHSFKYSNCTRYVFSRFFTSSTNKSISYCANIVKQYDYENFLATLLMTDAIRSPALVIRAFNVEIARIQDQTTDPQTASFRMQFWLDTLKKIFEEKNTLRNIPANPVAKELYKVYKSYNISKMYLERLIKSRNNLLKMKYFQNLEEVEKYAEESVSSIYYLILSIASVTNIQADHAASHLGKAQGITNILRSVHVSSQHKVVFFPMDILMNNQVSQETVLRRIDNENIRNVVFEMASRANSHLDKARKIAVPEIAHQILLPAASVESYLKKLQKCSFNVYHTSLQRSSAILPFNLFYKRWMNVY